MVNAQTWLDKNYPQEKRKNVKELTIDRKDLEGHLDLSSFVNLKSLDCSENRLTSLTINYSKLVIFYCNDNDLRNLDYSSFNPKELKMLNISNNNLSEKDCSVFSPFTNLEELLIGSIDKEKIDKGLYNRFTGSLKSLQVLKKLKELSIENTDIDSGLEYLSIDNFYCSSEKRSDSKVKAIHTQLLPYGREGRYDIARFKEDQKNKNPVIDEKAQKTKFLKDFKAVSDDKGGGKITLTDEQIFTKYYEKGFNGKQAREVYRLQIEGKSSQVSDKDLKSEKKKIQDEIDKFSNGEASDRNEISRSAFLKTFKDKLDLIFDGTEAQKKAVKEMKKTLQENIGKVELEICQYEAIEVIKTELKKRKIQDENKKREMSKDDLIEEKYIDFEEGIKKISEGKKEINDFKDKVLSFIFKVANAYAQLDALIAEGKKISLGKGESNGLTASDILSGFDVYEDCLMKIDEIVQKVFDQKRATINDLRTKLDTQAKQEQGGK